MAQLDRYNRTADYVVRKKKQRRDRTEKETAREKRGLQRVRETAQYTIVRQHTRSAPDCEVSEGIFATLSPSCRLCWIFSHRCYGYFYYGRTALRSFSNMHRSVFYILLHSDLLLTDFSRRFGKYEIAQKYTF